MEIEKGGSLVDMVVSGDFGCTHYKRKCKIRAPCCGEVFDCRHCHNEAKNSFEVNQFARHEIPRHQVTKVICSLCDKEQDVQQNCTNCNVSMGNYFCSKCKFFDDDLSKNTYHCDGCGICRVGGAENFFHCDQCGASLIHCHFTMLINCHCYIYIYIYIYISNLLSRNSNSGCCYSKVLKDSHRCIERAMHHNCPICYEYLFDSLKDVSVLQCGHTIHLGCLQEMKLHSQFACPVCSRSICDMSSVWEKLDQEVAATPMPEIYQNKMVWILCNDCGAKSNVHFHIVAHKCQSCNSYNTKQTIGIPCL